MRCPACGGPLALLNVDDSKSFTCVHRECRGCHSRWTFVFSGKLLLDIVHEGHQLANTGPIFTCPNCQTMSVLRTNFQPTVPWRCFKCGTTIAATHIRLNGGYTLPPDYHVRLTLKSTSGGPTPRQPVRRPTSGGGPLNIEDVASRVGISPKRLRAWLRKNQWRPRSEAGSGYLFTEEDVTIIEEHFSK